jgi:outer membrane immunogenic protein
MKIAFATLALCMAPVAAFAADLPGRKASNAPTQAPALFTWAGPYAGLNAGWGFGKVTDPYVTRIMGSIKTSGALGGLQVGYNHQAGDFVLGVEADYAMANVKGEISASGTLALGGFSLSGKATIESALKSFGTIRARAGVTMNSALIYATGGYAYGRNKVTGSMSGTETVSGTSRAAAGTESSSKTMSGWTLGAGVEYAITSNLSGKLEYLYADLGKATFFNGTLSQDEISVKVSVIRAGVNYRF